VIVRRLEAIEDLGSMDVLCTDKTGTLTEGVVALDSAADPEGVPSAEVLRLAHLNAAFETGIDNPLDVQSWRPGDAAGSTRRATARSTRFPTISSASA
jgi:Mg2+-importing ATPase